ncbi:MAG TPA: polysaccharide biosynthesis protein, partial [Acidimicrobiaceae bacterium]|nr:polysaccharide biosynthesis protein [Acidimicrobiaceae bacterium]
AARPLQITDLLGRDEVEVDLTSISNYLEGKVVLVTGAGGSIGSELCRQIVRHKPERLVMVDRDETALQGVELSIDGHGLLNNDNLVLADIRDRDRVFEVFAQHRPSIVFHAAALKHLPLLEAHPREGLLTNVFGSKNVLDAASSIAVDHFVNISTDKAANPTSVLGTTKRLAEALTVETGRNASGDYISVRFGNVIGSRGSVLPAFEAQITAGSPVTVTHPDITRYFMSIPEASRLVLQAGAIGSSGETLILDMGEPVKILDLAKKLIRHHKSDVEIVITGLRPNEKIHEELGHEGEVLETKNHKRIWHSQAVVVDVSDDLATLLATGPRELAARLMDLAKATATSDNVKVHS